MEFAAEKFRHDFACRVKDIVPFHHTVLRTSHGSQTRTLRYVSDCREKEQATNGLVIGLGHGKAQPLMDDRSLFFPPLCFILHPSSRHKLPDGIRLRTRRWMFGPDWER